MIGLFLISVIVDFAEVRIANSALGPHSSFFALTGRAEILHNGEWGRICGSGWETNDAQVFCRQLGFSGG